MEHRNIVHASPITDGLVEAISREKMKNKLVMRLLVEGEERQRLEADLDRTKGINRKIIRIPTIYGENHINPGAINDVETAYRTFESIRDTEYPNKQVTIEVSYD